MEFAEVVAQHQAWKQRLRRILLGRERRRRPERTEATGSGPCPLDAWLQANRNRFAQDPLFREVEELHRRSHELAVDMVLSDEHTKESMGMVLQIGQFQICSRSLLEALEKLRRKCALSETPLCQIQPGYAREEFPPVPDDRG